MNWQSVIWKFGNHDFQILLGRIFSRHLSYLVSSNTERACFWPAYKQKCNHEAIINKTSTIMIPRIKKMSVLDDYILFVEFDDGYKVLYDVKDDIKTLPSFRALVDVYDLFKDWRICRCSKGYAARDEFMEWGYSFVSNK